jgi:hypothetical protein
MATTPAISPTVKVLVASKRRRTRLKISQKMPVTKNVHQYFLAANSSSPADRSVSTVAPFVSISSPEFASNLTFVAQL